MEQSVAGWLNDFMPSLHFGAAKTFENLTLVPIFGPGSSPPMITLDEGLSDGLVEISEISESGSVPTLQVVNKGSKMLLLFDGEELVGAKQNRILNTTILVAGGGSAYIPVSCVEQGRWEWSSRHFHSEGRVIKQGMRRSKAVRMSESLAMQPGRYDANQGTIWEEVAAHARRRGSHSETGAMAAVFEKDRGTIESYLEALPVEEGQIGVAAYVNGELVGIDVLGRSEVYASLHSKLLRALAAEAIDRAPHRDTPEWKKPMDVLEKLREARSFEARPPGLGTDVRFEASGFHAAALVVPEGPVHLAVFPN